MTNHNTPSAEFKIEALDTGNVKMTLRGNPSNVAVVTLPPADVGAFVSHLLRASHAAFVASERKLEPFTANSKMENPILVNDLQIGLTTVQNQKVMIFRVGETTIGFVVNNDSMRGLGRSLIAAAWQHHSPEALRRLFVALLADFFRDLRYWSGVFSARFRASSRRRVTSLLSRISGRSLRVFRSIMIEPNVSARKYPPLQLCIYCGAKVYSSKPGIRSYPLGDEHIIAEGLGGRLELPEASCQMCEDTTGRLVEGDVLLRTLKAIRLHMKIRGKSRPKPATLPLDATINGKEQKIHIPTEDYPVILNMPVMNAPGIFAGRPGGTPSFCGMTFVMLRYDERALRKKYGITAAATPYWDTHMLLRMLAKIGHAFAVAELGVFKFKAALPEMVLCGKLDRSNYIGGDPEATQVPSKALHELALGYQRARGKDYVVARVRLFANHSGPVYHVVVGESVESRIAKFRKVFSSRISAMLPR